MGAIPVHLAIEAIPQEREPIRREKPQDAGNEGSGRESHDEEDQHNPKDGHQQQDMDEEHARQSQTAKSVEHSTCRRRFLIGIADDQQEADEEQGHQGSLGLRKQESDHGCKHQERARHHTAVDAYQGVDVVELHHEQRRECQQEELRPQRLADKMVGQTHQQSVDCRNRQRKPGFCYSVLKSFHVYSLSVMRPSKPFFLQLGLWRQRADKHTMHKT